LTVIAMAVAGFFAGFLLDRWIARLAREPYERGEVEEDDVRLNEGVHGALELHSETGSFAMPRALTTGSPYRRTAVVAATTGVFVAIGHQYGGDISHLAIVAAYAAVLIICIGTDLLAYRVPNVVTYPAILGAFAIGIVHPDASSTAVVGGGLLAGGLLFVPALLTGGAMGMGDVKLAFFAGLALGITLVIPALLVMAIAGGVVAGVLLISRLRGKGDPIPYAPFIAGGALVVMLLQGTAFHTL
jgi:prepilin signal peptidase PulO-like enzyme (type II secretory pathway)